MLLQLIILLSREVDELFAKGAIEPSTGGAGFYSNVFVVYKHTSGLWSIFSLMQFSCYMHIPTFKIPTIRQMWHIIQQDDYAYSFELKDTSLYIPIVKHHHIFLHIVWQNKPYQWRVLPFGLAIAPGVFTSLTKPILYYCQCKSFYNYYILGWYPGPDVNLSTIFLELLIGWSWAVLKFFEVWTSSYSMLLV